MIDHPQDFAETAPTVQQIPVPAAADIVPIDSLDQFVQILTAWHDSRKQQCLKLLAVPEGTQFQVGDGIEARDVTLEGPMLDGFRFGVEMALMQLGALPFAVEYEQAPQQGQKEWSGSPDPDDPDNFWIDDETGERVNAITGERTPPKVPANAAG